MTRRTQIRAGLAAVAIGLLALAGCRSSNSAGTTRASTVPDTTSDTTGATTTTTTPDQEAAYKAYRTFLDTSLAIGMDLNRKPNDGSLDPFTTPAYRQQIVVNLVGLKANGISQKGQVVTRLISSSVPQTDQLLLKVCSRDDVDQFDRTGKQLTPVGQGTPQVRNVGLVRQGSSWLVDGSEGTGAPCDV